MRDLTAQLLLLTAINFGLCTALGWTCLCRLNLMSLSTRRSFRAKYSVLLAAATLSGYGWLIGLWPNLGQVVLTAAFVYVLAAGSSAWRSGPPSYAQTSAQPGEQA